MEPIMEVKTPSQAKPKKTVEKPAPVKGKKKNWPKYVAGLLIAVIVIFLFFLFATDSFSPKKISVPDVTNLTVEEATKKLEAEGFVVGEEHQERNHEEIEKGKIIETDPAKNALRAKGTEIDLIVSLGVEMTTVDNYVGQNYSQVEALIKGKYKEVLKRMSLLMNQKEESLSKVYPQILKLLRRKKQLRLK